MEEGLVPAAKDMTDFEESAWKSAPCRAERRWDRGGWGEQEEGLLSILGLTRKTVLFQI